MARQHASCRTFCEYTRAGPRPPLGQPLLRGGQGGGVGVQLGTVPCDWRVCSIPPRGALTRPSLRLRAVAGPEAVLHHSKLPFRVAWRCTLRGLNVVGRPACRAPWCALTANHCCGTTWPSGPTAWHAIWRADLCGGRPARGAAVRGEAICCDAALVTQVSRKHARK